MLYVEKFTFGPFAENTYVIHNENKEAWILDPGMTSIQEEQKIAHFIETKNLNPQSIINTHAHIDHVLGVEFIKKNYNISLGIHPKEQVILDMALLSAQRYGLPLQSSPKADFHINEGKMTLGVDEIEVRWSPGHSPGSIVFYFAEGDWLIGGDVLFDGSIGRTDLPLGDFSTLENSIMTQIYTLPEQTVVYSGHGGETTIGKEKKSNPFVRI